VSLKKKTRVELERRASAHAERALSSKLRGELPAGSDLDLLLDSLYGPIYMRFLIRHAELTEDFADQLCELILKDCQPSINT